MWQFPPDEIEMLDPDEFGGYSEKGSHFVGSKLYEVLPHVK